MNSRKTTNIVQSTREYDYALDNMPATCSLDQALAPLNQLAQASDYLVASPLGLIERGGRSFVLPRYVFLGASGGGDSIRIGLFAGIHGDEPAGVQALFRFAHWLERNPAVAQGYRIFLYPVCNPSGFVDGTRVARGGKDLNREFWINSPEPEVRLLEAEIRAQEFHGLVSLHADDTSDGLYGFVRGAVLTRDLLKPALEAAGKILPVNRNPIIDGFPAVDGIISECYEGILTSPAELNPAPFEIILETPNHAPMQQQEEAFMVALQTILTEYQKFLSFAANL